MEELLLSQISEKFTTSTLQKMSAFYDNKKVSPPPGALFRAKTNNGTITAYHSGKVLFQGKSPIKEFERWASEQKENHEQQLSNRTHHSKYTPSHKIFTMSHIGSDESGTGDYFGPVTVCAVYVKQEYIEILKQIGIQDSKKITDKQIPLLAKQLIEMNIPYSSMVLDNPTYNKLQKQGWTQGKMKTMLHYHVIDKLLKKIRDEYFEGIVIDQFCQPTVFKKHLATENHSLHDKTYFITKAESYSIAVAAASVIARLRFLQEMERLSNLIDTPLLKGASKAVDEQIGHIIQSKGEEVLHEIAKVHFANTKKAKQLL